MVMKKKRRMVMKKKRRMVMKKKRRMVMNPNFAIANRAFNGLLRLAAELGLTPSTSARVKSDLPAGMSEFEKFRNENRS